MSSISLETFLATLYTDESLRRQFLAAPQETARNAGLAEEQVDALSRIDRAGLQMAAASYARKREQHKRPKTTLADTLKAWLSGH